MSNRALDSAAQRAAARSRDQAERAQAAADQARARWRRRKTVELAHDEVMLYSDETRVLVRARLGDGYPHRIPAAGGWEDEARPGQVAATVFRGADASDRLPLNLILGGWPRPPKGGASASEQVRLLRELGVQEPGARRGARPPLIRVRGVGVPHGGDTWFIESIEFDSDPRSSVKVGRQLVKAKVTVTLRQHVPVEMAILDTDRRRGKPGWRRYRVPRGQDAWEIARDVVGTRGARQARATIRQFRWASGPRRGKRVRDPKFIRAGDVLLIPTRPVELWGPQAATGIGAIG